jgi:predicted aldo/keto reductase-like oxidoreductase
MMLSTLGMGNMRLPTKGDGGPVDEPRARRMLEHAYESGINYFDTAYRYHGGESEKLVGSVLRQYPRDTWHLATKMPGHMMGYRNGKLEFSGYMKGSAITSPSQIFEDQLVRCGVDYFDFYLLHNVCETSYDFYTDSDLAVVDYLLDQKKAGRIKHLGISAHGRADTIDKFLGWRDCFEFVQIQLNYMDWDLQDAARKYDVIVKRGLPVIVMEPVRGGRLAKLSEHAENLLKAARPNASEASWAFRFLQALPGVLVVLSGMSSIEQLKENIELFSRQDPASEEERALLKKIVESMLSLTPCTGCRYCCEACPRGLDIPKLISMRDEIKFENPGILNFTLGAMKESELPGACIGCGACAKLCPQDIAIPEVLADFTQALKKFGEK